MSAKPTDAEMAHLVGSAIRRSNAVVKRRYLTKEGEEACLLAGYPVDDPPDWLLTDCPVERVEMTPVSSDRLDQDLVIVCNPCSWGQSKKMLDDMIRTGVVPVKSTRRTVRLAHQHYRYGRAHPLRPAVTSWHIDYHVYVGQCVHCWTIYYAIV